MMPTVALMDRTGRPATATASADSGATAATIATTYALPVPRRRLLSANTRSGARGRDAVERAAPAVIVIRRDHFVPRVATRRHWERSCYGSRNDATVGLVQVPIVFLSFKFFGR